MGSRCDSCKKNEASVTLTEIRDGKPRQVHLCEGCIHKKGFPSMQPTALGELLGMVGQGGKVAAREPEDRPCPVCGMTYRAFRSKGRLGCPHDYELFREELKGLLERIHGSSQYRGKVPSGRGRDEMLLSRRRELLSLRRELSDVIRNEEYERAARLRDRIQALEEEIQAHGAAIEDVSDV